MIKVSNVRVPVWGLVVNFSPPFDVAPTIDVSAKGTGRRVEAVAITPTGFTIFVLDSTGRSVGGLVDYTAR